MSIIKTVFDGNIHKFSLTQPSYDELERAVSSIHGKRGFSFRYQDDDGDLVTISSDLELQEALKINKGNLKLILSHDNNDFVRVDSPVRVHKPTEEVKKDEPKRTAAQAFWEAEEAREAAEKAARLAAEQRVEQPKEPVVESTPKKSAQAFWEAEEAREAAEKAAKQAKETPKPEAKESKDCGANCGASCEEARVAVYQLLTDPAVQLVLPELVKAVLTKFVQEARESNGDRSESAARVLETLTLHSVLKDHPAMNTLRPHITKIQPCLAHLLGAIPPHLLALLDQLKDTVQISAETLLSFASNPFGAGLDLGNLSGLGALAPVLANLGWFSCGPVEFGFECGKEDCKTSPPSGDVHSNIRCDVCGVFPIVGARYQCTVCRDFDLCAKCEATPNAHPAEHALVKHRQSNQAVVHEGITCDGCQQSPITGIRFKCKVCDDFDLCATCEAKNIHPADHPLVKFKVPRTQRCHRGQWRGQGLGMGHPWRLMHVLRELHGRRWAHGQQTGRWLARGSEGDAVKELQKALGVPVDGVFGPRTEEAVKKFQTEQGVPVDGVVGPRTRAKLFPSEERPERGHWRRWWLTRGSDGDAVKEVQKALGVPVDGVFGPQTEEAVKKFQTEQGLPVDGVVGPLTRAKLFPSEVPERGHWRRRWLTRGAEGDLVKEVQKALGVPVDGVFGSQTEEAVKKFQTEQGLDVDGIVGPRTRAKLLPSEETPERSHPRRRWLARGAEGEAVKELQQALGVPVDGIFGPRTEEAVKKFQTEQGIPVDGWVGPRTRAKLFPATETPVEPEKKEVPPEKKTETVDAEKPWLRQGAVGDAVKELQRALGVGADGMFGRLTERAVREFQFAHELAVDGLVGPATWAKLLSGTAVNVDAPMQTLINMGFKDVDENARLLRKFNGDVEQVVAEILGAQ